jgi:hypothetical protein
LGCDGSGVISDRLWMLLEGFLNIVLVSAVRHQQVSELPIFRKGWFPSSLSIAPIGFALSAVTFFGCPRCSRFFGPARSSCRSGQPLDDAAFAVVERASNAFELTPIPAGDACS